MDARGITNALGGRWAGSYGLARCPAHADKRPSLKISDDNRKGDGIDVYCFGGCTWQDVKAELLRRGLIDDFKNGSHRSSHTAAPAQAGVILPPKNDGLLRASKIWRSSVALPGTLGEKYFAVTRGLQIEKLGDLSHALRWNQHLKAVISLMTDPVTGDITGVQRAFLNIDGTKRERMMLGSWGVVRVTPDEDVTQGLGISEGVENALEVLLSGFAPVWATICAGNMARFPVLSGIEALTIFYDRDESGAGRKAAESCAKTWRAAGNEVTLR